MNDSQVTFLPLTPERIDPAREIYNHYVRNTTVTFHVTELTTQQFADMLITDSPRLGSWVIQREGRTIGWCCLMRYKPRCAFDQTAEVSVYLHPDATGAGAGRQAVEFLLDRAGEKGLHALIASISGENTRSLVLFEKMGFQTVGTLRQVGVKFDRRLDLVLMEKLL
ncbi:MAG: N-acetyltransferase family protein, partial [Phycisphaerae bacterium]